MIMAILMILLGIIYVVLRIIMAMAWGTSFILIVCKWAGVFAGSWTVVFMPILISLGMEIILFTISKICPGIINSIKSFNRDRLVLKAMKKDQEDLGGRMAKLVDATDI